MDNYIKLCKGHEGDVNDCSWSPVNDMLVSASGDGTIKVWNMNSDEKTISPLHSLTGHTYYVNSCVFNSMGDLMASSASDGTIRLWSTTTWKTVGILSGHDGPVRMCCFSRDGVLIASASGDQTVRVWETSSMKCLNIFDKHDCSVICCSFASVGWLLASGGSGGEVILSDVFNRRMLAKVEAHDLGVNWLEFAPDSDTSTNLILATVGQDNPVKIWRITIVGQNINVKLDAILHGHSSAVYSCSFSQNKKFLATGSADKSVIIWDVELKKLVCRIEAHKRFVTSCCFSPDGHKIASASNDKKIKVWNVQGIWSISNKEYLIDSSLTMVTPAPVDQSTLKPSAPNTPQVEHPQIPCSAVSEVCEWMKSLETMVTVDKGALNESETESVQQLSKGLESLSFSSSKNIALESLKCPITQEKFQDPVVAADGYTYERSAIMSWFMEGNRRSPTTNITLPNTTLFTNYTLKSILESVY